MVYESCSVKYFSYQFILLKKLMGMKNKYKKIVIYLNPPKNFFFYLNESKRTGVCGDIMIPLKLN